MINFILQATVGSSQRFYVASSVGGGPLSVQSNAACCALWQAAWEAGARVVAHVSPAASPSHLPELQPGRMRDYGQVDYIYMAKLGFYILTFWCI